MAKSRRSAVRRELDAYRVKRAAGLRAERGVYVLVWESRGGGGSFPLPSSSDSGAAVHASTMRRRFPWLARGAVRVVWLPSAWSAMRRAVVVAEWRAKGGK